MVEWWMIGLMEYPPSLARVPIAIGTRPVSGYGKSKVEQCMGHGAWGVEVQDFALLGVFI